MKIKKILVIEAMEQYVDLMLDNILEDCECGMDNDDLEFKTKPGKKITLISDEEKEEKGIPKRDGSGKGTRKNKGRSGCSETQPVGKGRK